MTLLPIPSKFLLSGENFLNIFWQCTEKSHVEFWEKNLFPSSPTIYIFEEFYKETFRIYNTEAKHCLVAKTLEAYFEQARRLVYTELITEAES